MKNIVKDRIRYTGQVILGDCLEIMSGMPPESIDLILTDPPYAIHYKSNRRVVKPKFDHINGDLPGDWIERFAVEAYRLLKMNRHIYCFCRHDTYPRFFDAFANAGFNMKRTLVWVKNNHGSGDLKGDYAAKDEWIIFAHKGRRLLRGKREDNIMNYPKVTSSKLLHPTQKPVELLQLLIKKSTDAGEVILDPYGGVLSTAVAAVQERRSFIMIDIERSFLEKGIARIKAESSRSVGMYNLKIP
ncbi:hypothetical protein HQ587_06400 [bacterium]|nr:hypothetical protein [bacterium]